MASSQTSGLSTGFILGSVITLAFFGLGYSLNLSFIFGLIASICGYCLGSWWKMDQPLDSKHQSPFASIEKGMTQILVKTKLITPDAKTSKRPTRTLSIFEWAMREHKTPPRPRR